MKLIFVLLAVTLFYLASAQTNTKKWDARLALGVGTYPYLKAGGGFLDFNIFSGIYATNTLNADLLYQTKNRKIKIGLAATHIKVELYYVPFSIFEGDNGPAILLETRSVTSVMPTFNYSYLLKRKVQLYSAVSFGGAFTKYRFYEKPGTGYSIDPAFQCTFFGCRFGNRLGIYTELGYGYKGIVQFGVSGTF